MDKTIIKYHWFALNNSRFLFQIKICPLLYDKFLLTDLQNAFDHNKAKKDGVIVPSKGRCSFMELLYQKVAGLWTTRYCWEEVEANALS